MISLMPTFIHAVRTNKAEWRAPIDIYSLRKSHYNVGVTLANLEESLAVCRKTMNCVKGEMRECEISKDEILKYKKFQDHARLSRVLTVSHSMLCTGGVPGPGGVTWSRRGCTWSRGMYLVLGVYLVLGGVPGPGGCTWS